MCIIFMHMFYRVMKGIYQFAANLLIYIPAKYYWNRSTSDLVIAKSRRVNFFWNTVYSYAKARFVFYWVWCTFVAYFSTNAIYSSRLIAAVVVTAVIGRKIHRTVSDPVNLAPTGPILSIRLARASPSHSGGGFSTFSTRRSLHVIRVGSHVRSGGTMIRTPEWRKPLIAPPLASTTKLTRNLQPSTRHLSTLYLYSPYKW